MLKFLDQLRDWWNPQREQVQVPRRTKNYGSQTGFQYQYRLEKSVIGEYLFVILAAGQQPHELRITVPLPELQSKYRYALAKLRLFEVLDKCVPGKLPREEVVLDASALDSV